MLETCWDKKEAIASEDYKTSLNVSLQAFKFYLYILNINFAKSNVLNF